MTAPALRTGTLAIAPCNRCKRETLHRRHVCSECGLRSCPARRGTRSPSRVFGLNRAERLLYQKFLRNGIAHDIALREAKRGPG